MERHTTSTEATQEGHHAALDWQEQDEMIAPFKAAGFEAGRISDGGVEAWRPGGPSVAVYTLEQALAWIRGWKSASEALPIEPEEER